MCSGRLGMFGSLFMAGMLGLGFFALASLPSQISTPLADATMDRGECGAAFDGELCTATLQVSSMWVTSSSCYLDEEVSRHVGVVTYPCAGGDAVAYFGDQVFTGWVEKGQVFLSSETTYDFIDGCTWDSHQYITGSLKGGDLRFSYTEAPRKGQCGCGIACSAEAPLFAR